MMRPHIVERYEAVSYQKITKITWNWLLFVYGGCASTFAPLFSNTRVELGTLLTFRRFAPFLSNLSIKLRSTFLFYRFTAFFTDFRIEFWTVLLTYSLAPMFSVL